MKTLKVSLALLAVVCGLGSAIAGQGALVQRYVKSGTQFILIDQNQYETQGKCVPKINAKCSYILKAGVVLPTPLTQTQIDNAVLAGQLTPDRPGYEYSF